MPMYQWVCRSCKKQMDVLRTFDGYRDEPTIDEAGLCTESARLADGSEMTSSSSHEWEKLIGAPHVTKGAAWRGSKGNW